MEHADPPEPRRHLRREGDGESGAEGGAEKWPAGCPASSALPPPFAAEPLAPALRGWGDTGLMSWGWGWHMGWTGFETGLAVRPPCATLPSWAKAAPYSPGGHLPNPASVRMAWGRLPEAGPVAMGTPSVPSANSEPGNQQTSTSWAGLLFKRHHRHTAPRAGGLAPTGQTLCPQLWVPLDTST